MDCILNGQVHGDVASRLLAANFDPGVLRPFCDRHGRSLMTVNRINDEGESVPETIVANADSTLLVREWIELDRVVTQAALPRLKAVADLRGRGLTYNLTNGMAKTVLQTQAQSDISGAVISMDGLTTSKGDRPVYSLTNLPIPIIHKDFEISARQLAVSRNGSMPLDTSMAELASRRVAEAAEQLLIGTAGSWAYGGGTLYGYTNWPSRQTKSLSSPLASGWTAYKTVDDVIAMRTLSQLAHIYGPWVLYTSLAWDRYLDSDLSVYKGTPLTLRQRLAQIEGIEAITTLDFLNGYDMVLVPLDTSQVREVVGMDVTTVQWETHGGMLLHFKVMCIMVPQLRTDYNGNCGLIHGSVSGQTTAPTGLISPGLYSI